MLKISIRVDAKKPSAAKAFDMKAHKKRFAELRPRRIARPRPQDHDGHGNIRFTMD